MHRGCLQVDPNSGAATTSTYALDAVFDGGSGNQAVFEGAVEELVSQVRRPGSLGNRRARVDTRGRSPVQLRDVAWLLPQVMLAWDCC